jgi:hypothetical protein
MPYETKEELLALAEIDPEFDAVSAPNLCADAGADELSSS